MNVIARLEFEVAYYDSAIHRFNHYTTRRTPPSCVLVIRLWFLCFKRYVNLRELFNAKATIVKEQQWYYSPYNWVNKGSNGLSPNGISPLSVVVNVQECDIVLREFELESRYYIHFRTNILRKGINRLITQDVCSIVPLLFLYKVDMPLNKKLETKPDKKEGACVFCLFRCFVFFFV